MSNHFTGMSPEQRRILHRLLNTQSFRETALGADRLGVMHVSDRAWCWERAAIAAGMLVELTDMMHMLKDHGITIADLRGARLLFDTIIKEMKERGHAFRADLQHGP